MVTQGRTLSVYDPDLKCNLQSLNGLQTTAQTTKGVMFLEFGSLEEAVGAYTHLQTNDVSARYCSYKLFFRVFEPSSSSPPISAEEITHVLGNEYHINNITIYQNGKSGYIGVDKLADFKKLLWSTWTIKDDNDVTKYTLKLFPFKRKQQTNHNQ